MNFAEFFLYIIVPLISLVYFFLKKKYSYFEENGIPYSKPSMIFGNIKGVGSEIHMADSIIKVYNENKDKDVVAGFYTMVSPSLIVTDLELIKQIMVKDFNSFNERGVFVNEEKEPLTGNLFAIGAEKWHFLRNKLSPTFTSGKIKMMYSTISDKGEAFVKAIEKASKAGSVDLKDIVSRFTLDVISNCAFGLESNTLNHENEDLVKLSQKVNGEEANVLRFFFMFAFPELSKFLNLKQFDDDITKFFNDVVGGSVAQRELNDVKRNDFLNMLIQLKNKGSIDGEISTEARKLTLDEVIAQAFVFLIAGSDTSSAAVSWALIELGKHIEIQEKLRKEIVEKTKASNGEITYDNIHEMTYLNQVVNETLRKYPPAFTTIRKSNKDYKIPNSKHVIKKGTQVMIPLIAIHNDDRFWTHPKAFDPERFSAEENAKRPNQAFIPFGEGPRNCIGMRFAQVNVKFALATIVKNFKVTLDTEKVEYPIKFGHKGANITPKGGFWAKFDKIF